MCEADEIVAKPSVFVTGASGFLGRNFLRKVDPKAYGRLVCLVRRPDVTVSDEGWEFVLGDLLETASYYRSLTGCDTVVHMAAATGKQPRDVYFRQNAEGTRILLEACQRAGVQNVLYVSTIAVNITDTSDYPYAESKRLAEKAVSGSGLRYTIIRPTIIMGDNSPVFEGLRKLALAPVLPLFGEGNTKVQPIDVGDLAEIIDCIVRDGWFDNRVLELGGPEVIEMELLLKRIRVAAGKKPGPALRVPVWPMKPVLGMLERVIPGTLPVTRGQLKALTSDGTARPDEQMERWRNRMKGIDEMLRSARGNAA
jgi:NADH dehydrogenase